jgi:hypothetical protein
MAKGKQDKNPAAVALGRLGGSKGGKARARKLTPKQRKESARKAAVARWSRKKRAAQKRAKRVLTIRERSRILSA